MLKNENLGRSAFSLFICLGFLNALTPFSIDLYLPTFSDIARDLNTNVARVSLSVSTYFVGYALGQLFYGPLLDRFGRKPPIYFGLALYLVSSLGCMTAQSVEALIFFRFTSALGGVAASVGAMTMVRDYFLPKEGARAFSMLILVLGVSPLLAPSIGAWIGIHYGWRAIFGTLSVTAILDFMIVMWALPKSYEPDPTFKLNLKQILNNLAAIFRVPAFRTYTVAGALSFSGLFVYLAGSPAIYLEGFQVSKQSYGMLFALLAVGIIGGGQFNNLLLKFSSSPVIFKRALQCQVFIACLFLFSVFTLNMGIVSTTIFLFLLLLCAGITYPNAVSMSLEPFTKNVGSASSLLGFIQMGLGATLASLLGVMDVKGTAATAIVMLLSSFVGMIVLILTTRRNLM